MIRSFKDRDVEELFRTREASTRMSSYADVALRKLAQLNSATRIGDLAAIPGNRLKPIGDGWAIRVNDQYRVRFRWDGQDAYDVEIGDFH